MDGGMDGWCGTPSAPSAPRTAHNTPHNNTQHTSHHTFHHPHTALGAAPRAAGHPVIQELIYRQAFDHIHVSFPNASRYAEMSASLGMVARAEGRGE